MKMKETKKKEVEEEQEEEEERGLAVTSPSTCRAKGKVRGGELESCKVVVGSGAVVFLPGNLVVSAGVSGPPTVTPNGA